MRAHIHLTAVIFALSGLLFAAVALLAPSLSDTAADALAESPDEGAAIAAALVVWMGRTMAVGGALLAVPALLCAWGLLRRKRWSRWVGILLGALALVQVPVGTIVGAYTLWVLLSQRFEPWFDDPAAT